MNRVLLIDDNRNELCILAHQISNYPIELHWARTLSFGTAVIESFPGGHFDLVVADCLGTITNLDTDLEPIKKKHATILVTSQIYMDIDGFFCVKEELLQEILNYFDIPL